MRTSGIPRTSLLFIALLFPVSVLTGFAPVRATAQALASASITGKVSDANGGALPNATITVTGPALQVPKVIGKADDEGNYTIVDLPAPGTYRISFEAAGFQTFVQADVHLTVGITGRVDASMKVGEVGQVVEVSGENPVIDAVSTQSVANIAEAEIREVPRGLRTQELLTQTQGVGLVGPPDVGDSNFGNRYFIVTYGVVVEPYAEHRGDEYVDCKEPNDGCVRELDGCGGGFVFGGGQ